MDFTLFDAGVAIVIVLSAILAFSRGFVREALAIAGWVVAAIVAYMFAPQATPLVQEIPVIADFLENCAAATVGGFIVVFVAALVVFALFAPLFSSLVQRSAFNAIDQGLGFLFGAIRGMILVAVALVVYDFVAGAEALPMVDDSQTAKVFDQAKGRIAGDIGDQESTMAWMTVKFEGLMAASCGGEPVEPSTNTITPEGGSN
ncbi:CvpA family protein [Alphaproteobacteria bacterium KMM 3653]|uniref:CvpA family protein n=1 Tax=Harenicola maris TaxID=2841044 RepID=A0AAP2CL01_9RHOB|nr:CvpA family protein [Harenicola maris]